VALEAAHEACRFYLTNLVHVGYRPLHERIVERARHLGCSGATVFKGFHGFLLGGPLLVQRWWSLSNEMPVMVQVVDTTAAVDRLLADVTTRFPKGIVTREPAQVIYYRAGASETIMFEKVPAEGATAMELFEQGAVLRIFIGDSDVHSASGVPLYEALVRAARERGLAGATVLRGAMGFGKNSAMHAAKVVDLSSDLPLLIEIVDTEERIRDFLPVVDENVDEGLVTLESVRIWKYAAGRAEPI